MAQPVDFARFIAAASTNDPATEIAHVDWAAAITALDGGNLPLSANGGCSGLRPASPTIFPLASARPSPALTTATSPWVLRAVLHASGRR